MRTGRTYPARVSCKVPTAADGPRSSRVRCSCSRTIRASSTRWWSIRRSGGSQPLRGRPSGATLPLREVATGAGAALGRDVAAFLDEDGLAEIDEEVRERTERLGSDSPSPLAAQRRAEPGADLLRAVPGAAAGHGARDGRRVRRELEAHHESARPERARGSSTASTGPGRGPVLRTTSERSCRTICARGGRSTGAPAAAYAAPAAAARRAALFDPRQPAHLPERHLGAADRHATPDPARRVLVDDTAGNRAFEHWVEREQPGLLRRDPGRNRWAWPSSPERTTRLDSPTPDGRVSAQAPARGIRPGPPRLA